VSCAVLPSSGMMHFIHPFVSLTADVEVARSRATLLAAFARLPAGCTLPLTVALARRSPPCSLRWVLRFSCDQIALLVLTAAPAVGGSWRTGKNPRAARSAIRGFWLTLADTYRLRVSHTAYALPEPSSGEASTEAERQNMLWPGRSSEGDSTSSKLRRLLKNSPGNRQHLEARSAW